MKLCVSRVNVRGDPFPVWPPIGFRFRRPAVMAPRGVIPSDPSDWLLASTPLHAASAKRSLALQLARQLPGESQFGPPPEAIDLAAEMGSELG